MTLMVANHFDDEIEALEANTMQLDALTPRPADSSLKVLKEVAHDAVDTCRRSPRNLDA